MQRLLASFLSAFVACVGAADLPVYCRLLQVGLQGATYQPILSDVNVSITEHAPLLGDVDISVSHLELEAVEVVSCSASVNSDGVFNVGFQRIDIKLGKLAWRYRQRNWPHTTDEGEAAGSTAASFNVSIDTRRIRDHVFMFHLDTIDIGLGATHHRWLTGALEKLVHFTRPLLSMVVQHEAQKVLDESLDVIRTRGACDFIQNVMQEANMATFSFTSYQPTKVHVPLVGDVDISVNSTFIRPPASMQCNNVAFNGHLLQADIEGVSFSAGFDWAYMKPGSSFWHNQGAGSTAVTAGVKLNIDLLQPSATFLKIDLPVLKLEIDAQSDAWMYHALTSTMTPLIREALQLFGGKFVSYKIKKCLEDPTCPHVATPVAAEKIIAVSSSVGDIIV